MYPHQTVKEILVECVQEAVGVGYDAVNDELQTEVRNVGLAAFNRLGQIIWQQWGWDASKVDEFETPAHDSDGVIEFAATVERIYAVKKVDSSDTSLHSIVWAQDERLAAIQGADVESGRFIHLAPSATGAKRIKIDPPTNTTDTYRALGLKKFVRAIVDSNYSAGNPSATPTDYRVQTWILEEGEPPLREGVLDALRVSVGDSPQKQFWPLLRSAIDRMMQDDQRELRVDPQFPMFEDVGYWDGWYQSTSGSYG